LTKQLAKQEDKKVPLSSKSTASLLKQHSTYNGEHTNRFNSVLDKVRILIKNVGEESSIWR